MNEDSKPTTNDEKLILYYYDELDAGERRTIDAALSADAGLRARFDALRRDLDGLGEDAPVTPPEHLVARWHDSIDRAAAMEQQRNRPSRGSFHLGSFAWGTAVTAALVLGIGIGSYFSGNGVPVAPDLPGTDIDAGIDPGNAVVEVVPPADSSGAFTRGLQVHFQQSRQDLGQLATTSSAEREMLIMHIIQQNRLFAREAKENDSPELARVLRAFEPILVRLAAADVTPGEAAKLQAKLAFELNVMLTKLERPPSEETADAAETI